MAITLKHRKFALLGLVVALGGFSACSRTPRRPLNAPPTAEEKAYFQNIEVSGARMTAAENFLNQRVVTLTAQVSNRGTKAVTALRLKLEFTGIAGTADKVATAEPIDRATSPLAPGETRTFSVSFDQMPDDWNQAPPRIQVEGLRLP